MSTPQPQTENQREIEEGVHTDFKNTMSYGSYLDLDRILSAQHPVSVPEHHDEMLFIIQHQTSELWLKLMLHELIEARRLLGVDDFGKALKCLARVKHIQKTLTEQWSVLATLTPREYAQFRDFLGRLRMAKDKAEFDQFMADRRNRPADTSGPQAQAQ